MSVAFLPGGLQNRANAARFFHHRSSLKPELSVSWEAGARRETDSFFVADLWSFQSRRTKKCYIFDSKSCKKD
jgi:hypothetical protein